MNKQHAPLRLNAVSPAGSATWTPGRPRPAKCYHGSVNVNDAGAGWQGRELEDGFKRAVIKYEADS